MKYPLLAALSGAVLSPPLLAQDKLEEIVVIASRYEVPLREVGASVSVITQEQIELQGFPTVAELLRTQPGVSVSNSGGYGKASALRIRGEEGFRTLVLIDGVEVSDPTATQVGPQMEHLMAGNDVERIEVLRGPQGFIYGADAGGVVNIITRTPQQGGSARLGIEHGRYDTTRFNGFAAYGAQAGDLFVSLTDMSTAGFNALVSDTSGERDGYDNTTWHARLGWNPSDELRAQLVVRDIRGENAFDRCVGTNDCLGMFDQTTAKVSLAHSGVRVSQTAALLQTDIQRRNFSAGVPSFDTAGQMRKLEYRAHWPLTDKATLVAGGDLKSEQMDVVDGEDLQRDQTGMFGELQWTWIPQWTMSAGARYDDHDDFGEHVSGRISSAYIHPLSPGNSLKLRASAGNGFRAPSLYEITYNQIEGSGAAVDLQLREERSSGFDLGLDYYRADGFSAQLTWFDQVVEDEIDFDLIDFSGYLQADGRSHSRGWELAVEAPMRDYGRLDVAFTRNHTRTTEGLQRTRRPGKQLNMAAYVYPLDGLTLMIGSRWVRDAENDIFGVGRVPLKNYQVTNASLNYQFTRHFDVFARVDNAGDEDYQEITGYNTAGRAYYLGLRYSFL